MEKQDPPEREPDETLFVPASGQYSLEENDTDEAATISGVVTPFQFSEAMPIIEIEDERQPPISAMLPQTNQRRSRLLKIALLATLLVVASAFLWFTVFAQPAQPGARLSVASTPLPQQTQQAMVPTLIPTSTPIPTLTPTVTGTWVPEPLPSGWANAGLTMGDSIEALRTAWIFTDREEGIDFRAVGTREQHAGTLTTAIFLLTPGGQTRFAHDVRVANNTLFDYVAKAQLIQAAVNPIPNLTTFAIQGGNQFAWVDVSYELFLSRFDPNNTGQRVEGLEMNAATNQPQTHHMSILLVRVAPGVQGVDASMGGCGWLVSNYGLDLQAPLTLVQPI
jgi:hypothetical protein